MRGKFIRTAVPLCLVGLLGGCAVGQSRDLYLDCGGHQIAVTMGNGGESLSAIIDNQMQVRAHQVEAASGAQYLSEISWGGRADTNWQFVLWNEGTDWMAVINDAIVLECTRVWRFVD